MPMSDALNYIKNDIIERCISELYSHGLTMTYKVTEMNGNVTETDNLLEIFLLEHSEKTENEMDFITTREIWDKYEDWRTEKYGDNREVYIKTEIRSAKALGMMLQRIGKYEKDQRKSGRGYKKIIWKSESSKVLKFLNKTTVKTEPIDRELNRISTTEMIKEYYKWLDKEYPEDSQRREKVGEKEFVIRVRKNGYITNTGYMNKEVTKQNGKVKIEHTSKERVMYVANLKWLPGVLTG